MTQPPEEGKTLLYDNMRKLISIIDELKDVGVQQYIQLPRIAVVGTQSAGKSSLLESIVGADFLPRGEGVVTRRPLELRLVHVSPNGEENFKPYAEFQQDGKIKYHDFDKVRDRIIHFTEQVAGKNKGIIDDPIIMTVYSTTCPDLTLVDLPGITRIPLANSDQTRDIEKVTKDMCRRYARDPRTIILAVVPANQDMATSDALKMAHEEDPQGIRTIGVITKIDIMDKGTNARRMLLGEDIPLKLGYVGVKGRSQLDINTSMKVHEALKIEKDYFAHHPVYSTLPPGHVGTEALTQKLSKVLFGHIRNTLPEIAKEIQNKIKECEDRLKDLGEPLPSSAKEKMQLLWNMITDFTENFKNNIKGKYDPKRNARVSGEISGGAKIKMMFQELYSEFNDKRATEHMTDAHINKAIVLHQGDSIPGFPSVDSFLFLIVPLLKMLKDPALELLNNVHLYLETLASQLIEKVFARFPAITDDITEVVYKVLLDEKELAKELVENVVESEKTYIFTNDIEYMTQRTSLIPTNEARGAAKDQRPVDPEKLFIDEMRARIDTYFAIVMRNIRDTIPKVIGYFLVKSVQEKMQFNLYNEINKNEELLSTMGEPPHITAERETLNKVLGTLRKARIVLTKDPDLAPTFKDANPAPAQPLKKATATPSDPSREGYSSRETSSRDTYNTNVNTTAPSATNSRPATSNPFGTKEEDDPRRRGQTDTMPPFQPNARPPMNMNAGPPGYGAPMHQQQQQYQQPSTNQFPSGPVGGPSVGAGANQPQNNPWGQPAQPKQGFAPNKPGLFGQQPPKQGGSTGLFG